MPGAVIAIQTFGDFLGFNSHLHILISDVCFHQNGMFNVSPAIDTKALEQIFRHKVLKMFIRLWRAPLVDTFPVYDDPQAPSADDYIIDSDCPVEGYF